MKKLVAVLLPLILVCGLVLAACGKGGSASSSVPSGPVTTIYMNGSNFTDSGGTVIHAATVKVNTPITFSDTISGGGTHFICVGTGNGGSNTCKADPNAPSQLNMSSGLMVANPQTPQVTFPHTGMFHILCTVHGGMYIDVTVS